MAARSVRGLGPALDSGSGVNCRDDLMTGVVEGDSCRGGGADSERFVGGGMGGATYFSGSCICISVGLRAAFWIISFIALKSKPACFGSSASDCAACPLGSTAVCGCPSVYGGGSSFSIRGGRSSSGVPALDVDFFWENPKVIALY